MSELPMLEEALREAAERRFGRRRRPLRLLVPALATAVAAAVAVTLAAWPAADDERVATPPPVQWRTATVVEGGGLTVSLPAGWDLARRSLTPHLTNPIEQFSAATFPLRYRKGLCNHQPDGALRDMRATDAFVTLQMRRGGGPSGFPPRPARFADAARPQRGDCISRADLANYWMPFRAAGRNFYAHVVLGRDVSAQVRGEAFAILDRLRIEPRSR